jgi:putative hydrolase of HD superfamily
MEPPSFEPVVDLLLQANRLKSLPRTGWLMRGLQDVESVADHTFGVVFVAMSLMALIDEAMDAEKVLTIAIIHDLPESAITDITAPALRYFPSGAKRQAELAAMQEMLDGLAFGQRLQVWWREYEERASPEARLVRDADRLELLLQAYVYRRVSANRTLGEFWTGQEAQPFEFEASQRLYESIRRRHDPFFNLSENA